ncbi:hypothetical protein, partial [Aeribacillus pallidus]|uniref:hypothetical protein n=1 Tax=Aeribacillus pallidus TaxID=33936 RepID=UPI000A4DD822
TLNQLYKLAKPHMGKKDIRGSVYATLDNGIPVKILFVRNRNNLTSCNFYLYYLIYALFYTEL